MDANGDGNISSDSAYTGGWTIKLYKDDGSTTGVLDGTDTLTSTTTSLVDGSYSFSNLGPGTYFVCEATKTGWNQTFPNASTVDPSGEAIYGACDNVAGNAAYGYKFTTASGTDLTADDFGNFELVSKSGTKFVDANGDGNISSDSAYTGGWTIKLYKDDGSTTGVLDGTDTLTSTTTSLVDGSYSFSNLGPGTYFVCEATKTGWNQTFPNASTVDPSGEAIYGACDNVAGNAAYGYKFTTASGTDLTADDFGNFELVSKSGTKFVDANGDGNISSDSAYTGGWTIKLYKDDGSTTGVLDGTDTLTSTTTSLVDGSYSFSNLGPGTYFVCEATKTGWNQTFPNASTVDPSGEAIYGACDNVAGNAAYGYKFTTASGTDLTADDFGNFELVSKSGTKFVDANGDGNISSDSAYTGGWTIKLYKDDGSTTGVLDGTDTLTSTTTSLVDGSYSFSNLGPGTYFVCEATKTGWNQTFPNASTVDPSGEAIYGACDNVAGNAAYGYKFTTASGTDLTADDFGNFELVSKSGTKFVDANGDGNISSDSAYTGGWTIKLYKDDGSTTGVLDGTDTLTSTTTSLVDGSYSFSNLGPGTYFVCEASVTDWVQSYPNASTADPSGEAIYAHCDMIGGNAAYGYKFTTASGTDLSGNDFGNWTYATKSGMKFQDQDANGSYNSSIDTPITGQRIDLWDVTSTPAYVTTTSTDSNGSYNFGMLVPGHTYAVCEEDQTSVLLTWFESFPNASTIPPIGESLFNCSTLTGTPVTYMQYGYTFTATSGAAFRANDFGNYPVAPGCTLTQGYWKTHSIYGPAAHPDDTWYLVTAAMTGGSFGTGPDSEFFDSGDTWYDVFQMKPKGGNAWVILAHQYMAAVLNQLNGAGNVSGLTQTLADAYALLDKWDSQESIPKNNPDRAEAIALADFLNDYNNGLKGVPHCGEPGLTTYPAPLG